MYDLRFYELDELCLLELVEYFLINEAMISRKLGLLFYQSNFVPHDEA